MSLARVPGESGLATTIKKSGLAAFAIRVFRKKAILHFAVTFKACTANLSVEREVETAKCRRVVSPGISLMGIDIIVIAKLITFAYGGVGMIQIILHPVGTWGVVANGVGVDVVEILGP